MEGAAGARLSSISSLSYPSFKPKVMITGMAIHADPEPVLVFDGPYAYQVKVKIPGGTQRLTFFGFGMTVDDQGMYIDGTVDVNESRLENYPVVRTPGLRRLYAAGQFSFTFSFPQEVEDAIFKGRSNLDGTIKFLVPKKIESDESETEAEAEAEAEAEGEGSPSS